MAPTPEIGSAETLDGELVGGSVGERVLGAEHRAHDQVDPLGLAVAKQRARAKMFDAPVEAVTLGRYVVIQRIGAGAMGVVFAAYDPHLDRKVAVKLLLPGGSGRDAQSRLLREAQAMAQLSHPNVVAVYDVGEHDDRVYVAMDFVRGVTLRAWLDAGPPSRRWQDVLAMFVQAGRGLAAAHDAGLVHRDFKPDNVMVDDSARARVMDFGLALPSSETHATSMTTQPSAVHASASTGIGELVGTPAYMAPEQFGGGPVDARTDQFAFCVSLWEGLFGTRPFAGHSLVEMAVAVGRGELREPPRPAQVPRWLRRVVQRGLAADPAMRWPSLDALLAELDRGRGRARMRAAALGLGIVVVAGIGAESWRRADRARAIAACEEEGAAVATVWPGNGDAHRAELRASLLASGAAFAPTTAEKVQPWLDDWAHAWQGARTRTCVAHDVERGWSDELAARADECLGERRSELEALLHELGRADPAAVQQAVSAAAGLSRVEQCEDPSLLERRPALPPEQRVGIDAVRTRLARARALDRAGKSVAAAIEAEGAVVDADALGWAPLQARARLILGTALLRTGAYDRAERVLADAYLDAGKSGATEVAQDAASMLALLVGNRLERHDDGLLWGRLAELERVRRGAPDDDLSEATRLSSVAAVEDAMGAYAEAKQLHARALAIREHVLGPEHPLVADSLNGLANANDAMGAYPEAKQLHLRALAIRERTFGPDHPIVANSLNNLGSVHHALGEYAEAEAVHSRAVVIRERALGPDHPDLAVSLDNLANVYEARRQLADTKVYRERALAIREKAFGAEHPAVAESLGNLGNVLHASGEWTAAKAAFTRALAILEKALGPEHPNVGVIWNNLAVLQNDMGEREAAKTSYERAAAITEKTLGPEHPRLATSLTNLAGVHVDLGELTIARALYERALAIREKALGTDHPDVADSLDRLARVRRRLGETAASNAMDLRALAIREKALGRDHPLVARSLTGLADTALQEHRAADAVPLLERALAIYERDPTLARDLGSTRFSLARALWTETDQRPHARELAERAADELRAAGDPASADLAVVETWLSDTRRRR